MTPQEKKEFEELKKTVAEMRAGRDLELFEAIRRYQLGDYLESTTSTTASSINQSIGAMQAFTSPIEFDNKRAIVINGNTEYIGTYNT